MSQHCVPYFTNEPLIRTMDNQGTDWCIYDIYKVNGLQGDTPGSSIHVYNGRVYAPDAYGDVNMMPILRSMVDDPQERNIKTLQYRNSQSMGLTQSTYAFNSYFQIVDSSASEEVMYSILYDTRGLTAREAGAATVNWGVGSPYVANTFPDHYVADGQYVSFMYRWPSNSRATDTYTLGNTYCYDVRALPEDPGYSVIENRIINSSLAGQSFRYSGHCDWQDWTDGAGNIRWAQFWIEDEKQTRTYITPRLYPKLCEEPGTMYLYYVNGMGGIDFVRSTYASYVTLTTEREKYETNADIDDRFAFGEETYYQRRWNQYVFKTDIVADGDSYNMADIVNTRWAWIYIPGDQVPWRSVKITNTSAKVKQRRNEQQKIYSYEFQLEDSIKNKIV